MEDNVIAGLRLVCTCRSCPEQYDVFNADGKQVGYLRLRHGHFYAAVPDCGGAIVYSATVSGYGTFDDDERTGQLTSAVAAINGYKQ